MNIPLGSAVTRGRLEPSILHWPNPSSYRGSGTVPDLSAQPAAPTAYQFFGQYIQTTSQAGLPSNATYTDKTQLAPRIGLTYSIDNKTVIRGGFGMFYEPEEPAAASI